MASPSQIKEVKKDLLPMDSVVSIQEKYPRVTRNFWREFPNATNTKWFAGRNCVYVYYVLAGRPAASVIRPGGFIEYSTRDLLNTELPENYSKLIADRYVGFLVINVREITINTNTSFIVLLENQSGYLEVAAHLWEIEELRKVNKSL